MKSFHIRNFNAFFNAFKSLSVNKDYPIIFTFDENGFCEKIIWYERRDSQILDYVQYNFPYKLFADPNFKRAAFFFHELAELLDSENVSLYSDIILKEDPKIGKYVVFISYMGCEDWVGNINAHAFS